MIARKDIPKTVRRITGGAKNPHEATIRRWYTDGVRGVRLDVVYVGREVFTTVEKIKAFFESVTLVSQRCRRTKVETGDAPQFDQKRAKRATAELLQRLAK